MTTDTILHVEQLAKFYGAVRAVHETSFTLGRGEFLTLLGPSGCGKTTTLRLIAGFEQPDAGTIVIHNKTVAGPKVYLPPEQRHIGMVFQDYALFPHLDVAGNVGFGVRGDARTRAARVAEMLALVGLDGYGDRMPGALSGGQQQRVALARALAPAPDLMLLDEPFSNLDAALRTDLRAELRRILRGAGVSVVFVTHDQQEALSLSDSIAVMFEGQIAHIAPPTEVYAQPATRRVAEFVGEAYWLPAEASGMVAESPLGRLTLAKPQTGAVDVLIRPEMLAVGAGGTPARVIWREFYGHDQRIGVTLHDGRELVARAAPRLDLTVGEEVSVRVIGAVVPFARTGA